MTYHSETLSALIGSRICHDLISPIGAVNNGLELLALSGGGDGPEMTLVSDSAASANARIRLLRLAFGLASATQITRADELTSAWSGVHAEGRVTLKWAGPESLPRPMARLVLLACMCAEVALHQGGNLVISQEDSTWKIRATGPRIAVETGLWDTLTGLGSVKDMQPAHVQFLLLPHYLAEQGRRCDYSFTDKSVSLAF